MKLNQTSKRAFSEMEEAYFDRLEEESAEEGVGDFEPSTPVESEPYNPADACNAWMDYIK